MNRLCYEESNWCMKFYTICTFFYLSGGTCYIIACGVCYFLRMLLVFLADVVDVQEPETTNNKNICVSVFLSVCAL